MYPLFLCAIVSVTVIVERYFALRSVLRGSAQLVGEVQDALLQGRDRNVVQMLELRGGPIARLLLIAVRNRALARADVESLVSGVAVEETPALARGLNSLDTIITIAPLLGLLGTVTGMIKAFKVVSISSGQTAPAAITGGVAEALIATATGLAIAIVTLVGYNFLTDQVKRIISTMEIGATKVINTELIRKGGSAINSVVEQSYATPGV